MNHSTHNLGLKFSTEATILFGEWSTKSWWSFLIVFLIILGFSFLFEYIQHIKSTVFKNYTLNMNDNNLRQNNWKNIWKYKIILGVLHVVSLSFHYSLMLIIMSFNLGLIFSILMGAGIGYIIFLDEPLKKNEYASIMKDTSTPTLGGDHCDQPIILNYDNN